MAGGCEGPSNIALERTAGSHSLAPLGFEDETRGRWVNRAGGDPRIAEAFLQGLRDFGYVEGRSLVIEWRDAEGKPERFPALAAELVALKLARRQ